MQKAWLLAAHAFFAWAVVAFLPAHAGNASCSLTAGQLQQLQPVTVTRVIDGDTVRLASGRRVRLIGINTLELKDKQPLAQKARVFLADMLADSSVWMQTGSQQEDRHKRLLAHLFLDDGRNIEAVMLQQGMGFPVAIPPNLALVACHEAAADKARQKALGVWSLPARQSTSLQGGDGGFKRVFGRLESIKKGGGAWWLRMEGPLVLRITAKDQRYFDREKLDSWVGKEIEVTGWIVDRSDTRSGQRYAPLMLLLTHPLHIRRRY